MWRDSFKKRHSSVIQILRILQECFRDNSQNVVLTFLECLQEASLKLCQDVFVKAF